MNISRPKRKTIIQIILVILAIFVIRLWQQQDLIEGNVPSFTSTSLTGESLSSKPWANEPLLIHFWATWCPICEMENDNIQNVAKDYRTLNIAIQSGSDKEITEYANKNNLSGLVCSPLEINIVRKEVGRKMILVVPGIRPNKKFPSKKDDQKRTLTPKEAIDLGADFLVIGRPIVESKNPLETIKKINKSIQ